MGTPEVELKLLKIFNGGKLLVSLNKFPRMSSPRYRSAIAAGIVHLLNTRCRTKAQVYQILAQILLHNLRADTTVAHHFITACHSANLLTSTALPLFINERVKPHTFVCNCLLKTFAHSSTPEKSPIVYSHMHKNSISVNYYSYTFVLKALADLMLSKEGASVHAQINKLGFLADVYIGNSLLNLYAATENIALCAKVFDEMPLKDVVSWTIVISGFKDAGRFDDALIAFEEMRSGGVMLNQVTAVNALAACACSGALDMGVWIHQQVKRRGWQLDAILGTSLIDMYGKCGQVNVALQVFDEMHEKNVFTWNAIIRGLAVSKNGNEAVKWFSRMEDERIKPDEVTLLAVLCSCVHSGLVHMGRRIFSSLVNGKYGISPSVKHYGCMVDLLVRSKCLDEALEVIKEMPFEPTVSIWGALLDGCRTGANYDLGEITAWKLVELEPDNCASYVVLSNLYAEMGRWRDVDKVRQLIKDRGLKKDKGSSAVKLEYTIS